jgi:hypothetical protein
VRLTEVGSVLGKRGKMTLRLEVGIERIYRADINWVVEMPFVLRFQSHNKSVDQPMSFSSNVWPHPFEPPYRAAKPIICRSQDFLFLPPNLSSFHLGPMLITLSIA